MWNLRDWGQCVDDACARFHDCDCVRDYVRDARAHLNFSPSPSRQVPTETDHDKPEYKLHSARVQHSPR